MENFLGRYNDRGFSECDFAGTFFGTWLWWRTPGRQRRGIGQGPSRQECRWRRRPSRRLCIARSDTWQWSWCPRVWACMQKHLKQILWSEKHMVMTVMSIPEKAKWPVHEDIVAGGEGNANEDEEEVGNREVQNQHVCRVLHLRVRLHLWWWSWWSWWWWFRINMFVWWFACTCPGRAAWFWTNFKVPICHSIQNWK